jgi:hypothetical protein
LIFSYLQYDKNSLTINFIKLANMDVSSILIVLPLLIIFSYLFDIFARRTKFPSVILLVFTGIIARGVSSYYGYSNFEFLDSLVPVLGTIGLILIQLIGSFIVDETFGSLVKLVSLVIGLILIFKNSNIENHEG